jgi:hypothetical protein
VTDWPRMATTAEESEPADPGTGDVVATPALAPPRRTLVEPAPGP